MGGMKEMADSLIGYYVGGIHAVEEWTEYLRTDGRTHTRTKVTTVYLPVSLRSLGGYNNGELTYASVRSLL